MPVPLGCRRAAFPPGFTILELLFTISLVATVVAIAIPLTAATLDHVRATMAARYMAGRIAETRTDAVRRSGCVALRFERSGDDYFFAPFVDGNANGVRTADIRAGVDRQLGSYERLSDKFPGVRFELLPGVPDADGNAVSDTDGVRIGSARILTLSPDGTATSGTLYLRGRRDQYAVRILGITGRARVLQYHSGNRSWINR